MMYYSCQIAKIAVFEKAMLEMHNNLVHKHNVVMLVLCPKYLDNAFDREPKHLALLNIFKHCGFFLLHFDSLRSAEDVFYSLCKALRHEKTLFVQGRNLHLAGLLLVGGK